MAGSATVRMCPGSKRLQYCQASHCVLMVGTNCSYSVLVDGSEGAVIRVNSLHSLIFLLVGNPQAATAAATGWVKLMRLAVIALCSHWSELSFTQHRMRDRRFPMLHPSTGFFLCSLCFFLVFFGLFCVFLL